MEKVLIVDDEVDILKVIKKYLHDDYDVVTATNGHDALEIYKQEKPSVLVTDIRMPGMDGIELIKAVKGMGGEVEIIAITGHGDTRIGEESLRVGASDFLMKPLDVERLESSIEKALGQLREKRRLVE